MVNNYHIQSLYSQLIGQRYNKGICDKNKLLRPYFIIPIFQLKTGIEVSSVPHTLLMILAGLPAITTLSPKLFVTTAPEPTTTL